MLGDDEGTKMRTRWMMPVTPTKFSVLGVFLSVLAIAASTLLGGETVDKVAPKVNEVDVAGMELQVAPVTREVPVEMIVWEDDGMQSC